MYKPERADRVLRFIRNLKLIEGRWGGHKLELMPWQEKVIRDVYGTIKPDGYRQYRWAYIEVPKKSGKSPFAAANALNLLFNDDEPGAQIYGAATERDQAAIVFKHAAGMVRQSPPLLKRCDIIDSQKTIAVPGTYSSYKVLSAEAHSKHGFNIHGLIFDELHALKDREFWDVLTSGAGDARTQPLFIVTTTAGFDRQSVCWELHEYARKVSEGVINDPTFYSVVYSLDEEEDWEDERNWTKVNPSLGVTIDIERIREHYRKAKELPSEVNNFRRFRLCQWTRSESRWMDLADWKASAGEINKEELEGEECYAGLDLANKLDVTAFELVFPREDGIKKVLSRFWIPEENIEQRVKRDRVPYDQWVEQGYICATRGNVIDYEQVFYDICELGAIYNIREIAFDRWGAMQISQQLADAGFETVEFGQGFKSFSEPTKDLQVLVKQKKLHHGNNPVLTWMADNMVIDTDARENICPNKKKSSEKIDGMVGLIMALDRALRNENAESIYNTRGILTT